MKRLLLSVSAALAFCGMFAQNPIVTHCYTADPAPMAYEDNDSLYVYCDEDMNVPGVNDFYYMDRWRVYSTVDMVNWTDHGLAMPRTNFKWANAGSCWASQCVKKGKYYYWYMCCQKTEGWVHHIGAGRSEKPSGPFKDILKQPIISTNTGGDIDPTAFIDDNGQAYLYWGNNKLYYVKLNNSMLAYYTNVGNKGLVEVPLTKEAFGGVKVDDKVQGVDCYEEGPWLDKRGDNYYLMYAAGGVPEHISYSMSKSPEGPWEYKGQVMKQQDTGSFTNHSGIVNYKGKDYFFFHTGWAPGGGGYNRSMSVEEFKFNEDGTFPEIKATKKGVAPLCTMNPFIRQQAETLNAAKGIEVVGDESKGVYVTAIHAGDSTRVRNVDFGEGNAKNITLRIATAKTTACMIVIRQDHARGKILAKCKIQTTGGNATWEEQSFDLSYVPKGVHDVHFTFTGTATKDETLFNWDWWKFNTAEEVGINDVNIDDVKKNDGNFYDLTGRMISEPKHGIYIKNGKKTIIK